MGAEKAPKRATEAARVANRAEALPALAVNVGVYQATAASSLVRTRVLIPKSRRLGNRNLLANLSPPIDFKRYYFPENFAAKPIKP
jgi:hypothetical protein